MNQTLLREHIDAFATRANAESDRFTEHSQEREELVRQYRAYSGERLSSITVEDLYEYISPASYSAFVVTLNKEPLPDQVAGQLLPQTKPGPS